MDPAHDVWNNVRGSDHHARLTCRQREVLALMASGWTNGAIARRLAISEKAVVQHTSQIYDRLDLFADDETHRRVHAVLRYLAHAAAA